MVVSESSKYLIVLMMVKGNVLAPRHYFLHSFCMDTFTKVSQTLIEKKELFNYVNQIVTHPSIDELICLLDDKGG